MKIILVGAGAMGLVWVNAVLASAAQGWELTAIADTDAKRIAMPAMEYSQLEGIPTYDDPLKALSDVDADVALISTPPDSHRTLTEAALAAGKHVLVEKPLAGSMADARAMVAAADKAGLTLMVAQNYRYNPAVRAMNQVIAAGGIGDPGYTNVMFQTGPDLPGYREKLQFPLLEDMAIHHFDMMRYITGADPVTVYAHSWKPTWSWYEHDPALAMIFTMSDGSVVDYFGSWVALGEETPWDGVWRVQGSTGCLTWDGAGIRLARPAAHPVVQHVEPPTMARVEQLAILDELAESIANHRQPETSGADNLKSLAMVFAGVESAKTGKVVKVTG